MTRKQARNQVRRALGEGGEQRFKVHAYRHRSRCVIEVHRCSRHAQERGRRWYVGIAPTWAQSARQAAAGFMVTPGRSAWSAPDTRVVASAP
jgi:hypothetical protein